MKERMFIKTNIDQSQLEEFIRKEFNYAKVGDIELQHTPIGARIIIHTLSPGLVIGSEGSKIREIGEKIKNKFNVENAQIDVQRIDRPDLDPNIVVQSLVNGIENNVKYKRLGNQALERVMASGAIGCEIVFSGKLGGERGRRERFMAGFIKKSGDMMNKFVKTGFKVAYPRLGAVGITVKIMTHRPAPILSRSKFATRENVDVFEKIKEEEKEAEKEIKVIENDKVEQSSPTLLKGINSSHISKASKMPLEISKH
ncbi:MAG: 30S ribosomal protein S3, partial [Candidatus Aenigmatarchaeota archaeon]